MFFSCFHNKSTSRGMSLRLKKKQGEENDWGRKPVQVPVKTVKDSHTSPCFSLVWPPKSGRQPRVDKTREGRELQRKEANEGGRGCCKLLGSLPPTISWVSSLQSNEIISVFWKTSLFQHQEAGVLEIALHELRGVQLQCPGAWGSPGRRFQQGPLPGRLPQPLSSCFDF